MIALIPLVVIFIGLGIFFLYLTLTEYSPEPIEDCERIRNSKDEKLNELKTVTTFNIGYCSLDKSQDFFLEGGTQSKTLSRDEIYDNLINLTRQIENLQSDFYILQEVDTNGSRSKNINQVEHISSELIKYNMFFAYNYKAKWVPIPLFHPIGSAYSGLLTMSKKQFLSSKRHSLDGQESFPKSLFYLKRCMTVNEFQINRNKVLYLINIHLSAYDKEGQFRSKQINHIIRFITNLYDPKINYIIVGGDFNLLLDKNLLVDNMPSWVSSLPEYVYKSDFRVVFDNKTNTVRSQDRPYQKGQNFETVIDGFLVSPNITVSDIKTHDLGFKYTDHNPVTMSFRMK